MRLRIVYDRVVSDVTGCESESLTFDGSCVRDLVDELSKTHGPQLAAVLLADSRKELRTGMVVLVDGHRLGLSSQLADNVEVAFMMAIAGGSI